VLNIKPALLHPGQRAFIANGDVSQCIHTVLDVFEEFNEIHRAKKEELHVVAYDVQRAFDAVQADSIRATLNRFHFLQGQSILSALA
jgi:pyridoxal biosynthesis lyase PdxS